MRSLEIDLQGIHRYQIKAYNGVSIEIWPMTPLSDYSEMLMVLAYKHAPGVLRPAWIMKNPKEIMEFAFCREILVSHVGKMLMSDMSDFMEKKVLPDKEQLSYIIFAKKYHSTNAGFFDNFSYVTALLNKYEKKAGWILTKLYRGTFKNCNYSKMTPSDYSSRVICVDKRWLYHPALFSLLTGMYRKSEGTTRSLDSILEKIAVKDYEELSAYMIKDRLPKLKYILEHLCMFKEDIKSNYVAMSEGSGIYNTDHLYGKIGHYWSGTGVAKFITESKLDKKHYEMMLKGMKNRLKSKTLTKVVKKQAPVKTKQLRILK